MNETIRDRVVFHLDEVLASPSFADYPKYATLLRYLVEQTLADKPPHEIDIAVDVFRNHTYNPAENSSVRVSVHQLRKMLLDYYSQSDSHDDVRLSIPKGSYRVSFGIPLTAESAVPGTIRGSLWWLADNRVRAVAALLLVSLGVNLLLLLPEHEAEPVEASDAPYPKLLAIGDLTEGAEPILIVLGDFFFFQEGESEPGLPEFIRRVDINSADDLRRFAGDEYGVTVTPSQRSYLPKSAAFALQTILPLAQATGKSVSLKLMSDVSGGDLRDNDVIYIGYLRSMGPLRDYFFRSSNFCAEPPFSELIQKDTGDTFARSGYPYEHVVDYGLFARVAGPAGGEMLLFTGISDVGIMHTVRALTEPNNAREVEQAVVDSLNGIPPEFEVLFEVSGYDRSDLIRTNIAAFRRRGSLRSERDVISGECSFQSEPDG